MNKKFTFKIITIAVVVLALLVPLMMITDIISERSWFRDKARASIADSWTGTQKVLGPVLVAPYTVRYYRNEWDEHLKAYKKKRYQTKHIAYILPEELKINGRVNTEQRSLGIYSIPVYTSQLALSGRFSNDQVLDLVKTHGDNVSFKRPHLSVVVTDIRGIDSQPQLNWQGNKQEFRSGSELAWADAGMHVSLDKLTRDRKKDYSFDLNLNLRGMESIQFSPVAKSTDVTLSANWPHPGFVGRFLPATRNISDLGFDANWKMSSFSSDMPRIVKACGDSDCANFVNNAFGVSLINSVDIYHKTERSVKYAILFISLIFVVFFLFEIMKGLRLHPMQYLMVGLAQTFFYLLLISLSEHISFLGAYVTAATASTVVIVVYLAAILNGWRRAAGFGIGLTALYGMLYTILVSEDNALLMGSMLVFVILTIVMMITRRLDWYQVTDRLTTPAIDGQAEAP